MISVESWGIAGGVVDAGRRGRAWLGAARGGAVDLSSLALVNRLLGNPPGAGAVETSGGSVLRVETAAMVAVAGATAQLTVEHGPPLGWGSPVVLPAGAVLRVGRLLDGARCYVGVRGGVSVDDDVLHVGPDPRLPAASEPAPRHPLGHTVRLWPGPRLDWFSTDAWTALLREPYAVTATSRVGSRLAGPVLARSVLDELPSEGMVEGAVQVPPDGQPIVMLADHPTTGGYPVIAVVHADDLPLVAQTAVGTTLRFVAARRM